jgi:DNA ligase-1
MLAMKAELHRLHQLVYPMLGSPKIDGIRGFVHNGSVFSRKLKSIPNTFVHQQIGGFTETTHGLDGELVVGRPNHPNVYNVTSSGIMSRDGAPPFNFWVFDDKTVPDMPFAERIQHVQRRVLSLKERGYARVRFVSHQILNSPEEVLAYEERCLNAGYEGIMLRAMDGPYRRGRCGVETPWLYKLKRFIDAEAVVIGVREKLHNDNPLEVNELGRAKRSGHKENKRLAGTLGGFDLQLPDGTEFSAPLGKGWTAAAAQKLWNGFVENPATLLGKTVTFYSLPHGVKDRPRHPKVKGFRNVEIDG